MSSESVHRYTNPFSKQDLERFKNIQRLFAYQLHETGKLSETDLKKHGIALFRHHSPAFIDLVNGNNPQHQKKLQKRLTSSNKKGRRRAYSKGINQAKNFLAELGLIKLYQQGTQKLIEASPAHPNREKLKAVENQLHQLLDLLDTELTETASPHRQDQDAPLAYHPNRITFTLQDQKNFLAYLENSGIARETVSSTPGRIGKRLQIHLGSSRGTPTRQRWYIRRVNPTDATSANVSRSTVSATSAVLMQPLTRLKKGTHVPSHWSEELVQRLQGNSNAYFEVLYGQATPNCPSAPYFLSTLLDQELMDLELVIFTKNGVNNPLKFLDYKFKHGHFFSPQDNRLGLYQTLYQLTQSLRHFVTEDTLPEVLPLLVGLEPQPKTRYVWELFNPDKSVPQLQGKSTWTDHEIIQHLTPERTLLGPITVNFLTVDSHQLTNLQQHVKFLQGITPQDLDFSTVDRRYSPEERFQNFASFKNAVNRINTVISSYTGTSLWKPVNTYRKILTTLQYVNPELLREVDPIYFAGLQYQNYYFHGQNTATLALYTLDFITYTLKVRKNQKKVQKYFTYDIPPVNTVKNKIRSICDIYYHNTDIFNLNHN